MVVTRSGSKFSSNQPTTSNMATTEAGVSHATDVVSTVGLTTTTSSTAPALPHDLSLSPDDLNSTIISPEYSSITAQSVRREVRESMAQQQNQNLHIQEVINASIGLSQAQFMKQVDDKINNALTEIKLALNINNPPQQVNPTNVVLAGTVQNTQARGPELLSGATTQAGSLPPVDRNPGVPVYPQLSYPYNNQGVREVTSVTYTQPQPVVTQVPWSNPPPPMFPEPRAYRDVPEAQVNHVTYGRQPQMINQPPFNPTTLEQQQEVFRPPQPGFNQQQQGVNYHQPPQQHNFVGTPNYAWPVPNAFENHQRVNLAKWGIKFDGTSKSMNAQEFIFRINELRRDYNCSDIEILRHFHNLLEGPALDWYWNHRKLAPINSWRDLENAILTQYQRFENEYQIQMQILNRRQLPQESFEDFYNVIIKLRHQQKYPYDEKSLMDIMRGNLKPSLAQLMFPIRINSLTEFCREVKRAENLLASQRQSYQQRANFGRVNEIEVRQEEEVVPVLEVDAMQNTNRYTCWNCRVVGHGFFDCPSPTRRIFCFKCGMDNVVTPKCPRCQGNRNRNPSRTGEARSTEV